MSALTSNLRPLTICHFQQTVKKLGNLDILSHYTQKGGRAGGVWHLSTLLPKLALSKVFSQKHQKLFLTRKVKDFFYLVLQPMMKYFVMLNPSEKNREKHCFLILSLLSHNLTGKLSFSQKRVMACCFWCFQMLILMLSN